MLVAALCFLGVPISLARPFFGLLFYCWLAYMRLQDFSWGFAREMQWSKFVAISMLIGILIHNKEKFIRFSFITMMLFFLWVSLSVSSIFSLDMDASLEKYPEFSKAIFIAAVSISLVNSEERIKWLMVSFGLALGIQSIRYAIGGFLIGGKIYNGPGGTIEDNNDFALSLVMTIPVLYYLGALEKRLWLRLSYWGMCCTCMVTILWTHSRGGLLGICAVLFLVSCTWRNKIYTILFWFFSVIVFFAIAPQSLLDRYATIETAHEKDASAVGRLHAWRTAYNMGMSHPLTGVGPRVMPKVYWDYAPQSNTSIGGAARVAHNGYAQIFADSGFPGFICFVTLIIYVQTKTFFIRLKARKRKEIEWSIPYTYMLQYSVFGYMVCVTFLSREYFEYFYQIVAAAQSLNLLTQQQMDKRDKEIEDELLQKRKAMIASRKIS